MNESTIPAKPPNALIAYPDEQAEALIAQFPELYDNHLNVARYLDDWASRVDGEITRDRNLSVSDRDYLTGYARALSDVAHHLAQGDCLPGGPVYLVTETRLAEPSSS